MVPSRNGWCDAPNFLVLYKIFGGGGNTLVFVQRDGVVLVDTKLPGNGQAILDQVRTITDKPITSIINTHNHPDHIGSKASDPQDTARPAAPATN